MKKLLCKPCAKAMEARGKTVKEIGGRCEKITCAVCGRPGNVGVYGERMGRRVDGAERSRILAAAEERQRESRWAATGRSRVVHPVYGTVVVPHASNLAAVMCAAEVWRCDWAELSDAKVWRAGPGDVAVKMPYII